MERYASLFHLRGALAWAKTRLLSPLLDLMLPKGADERMIEAADGRALAEAGAFSIGERGEAAPIVVDRRFGVAGRHYASLRYRVPLVGAAVRAAKYRKSAHATALLGAVAASGLAHIREKEERRAERTVAMPIPASAGRERERGYNQAEEILKEAERALAETGGAEGFEFVYDAMKKREAASQTEAAGSAARFENLKGCFFVARPDSVRGKRVIIVDDVLTTGATLEEARRTLHASGARSVETFALAH